MLASALLLGLAACSPPADTPRAIVSIDPPSGPGAAEPNLVAGADGRLYLSWVEPAGDGDALRFATWEGEDWSPPRTVASGSDWFVNWADFPSMAALEDGTLAAHWLAKVGTGTYAYGVFVSLSRDGGATWSEPVVPHRDGTETEHGFVSLVPLDDGFLVIWLDGRETERDGGAMTLRATTIDREGRLGPEIVIDERVCDCCPTDARLTAGGTVVTAFRDRSPTEVRDIGVSRWKNGRWTAPAAVHSDGWEIAGCPVNGPALASDGETIACVWYTGRDDDPTVFVAFSRDAGDTFDPPVRVDGGSPLGRCDVELLPDGSALVSWLEDGGEEAEVRVRRVAADGTANEHVTVTTTRNSRASGFPRLASHDGGFVLAWTEPDDPSRVRASRLR